MRQTGRRTARVGQADRQRQRDRPETDTQKKTDRDREQASIRGFMLRGSGPELRVSRDKGDKTAPLPATNPLAAQRPR